MSRRKTTWNEKLLDRRQKDQDLRVLREELVIPALERDNPPERPSTSFCLLFSQVHSSRYSLRGASIDARTFFKRAREKADGRRPARFLRPMGAVALPCDPSCLLYSTIRCTSLHLIREREDI